MASKRDTRSARLTYLLKTPELATGFQPVPIRKEPETLQARARRCFDALDGLDADSLASFFAADAIVRLPALPPISGRAAIRTTLLEFLLEVEELQHEPVQLWTAGNISVFEADATLALANRAVLTFPITYIIRWKDGLIAETSVNVYLESRLAVAMSSFARTQKAEKLRRPA